MAFGFTPQVVNSGSAVVIDASPLLQAHMMNNQRKHQQMREDKQRAEAEYNYDQEQLADLIGKGQGEDAVKIDLKIQEAQKWLSDLNKKGQRVNTPENKAEYRRRISEIQALTSRSKSSHQTYALYQAQMAQNPYLKEKAQNDLFLELQKPLEERSAENMKRIFMGSYDIDKYLTANMTDSESEKGIYTIYDKIHRIGDNGKVELYTNDALMKKWITGDQSEQMDLSWSMAIDQKKDAIRLEQEQNIADGGKAFSLDSTDPNEKRKAMLLNGGLSPLKERQIYTELHREGFKESYSYDKNKVYKPTKDEIEKGHVEDSITNMANYVATGGDMTKVLQSFSGTSKEGIRNIPISDVKKMKENKSEIQTQLIKDKASKASLDEKLTGDLTKEEKIDIQSQIQSLNTKIRQAEDQLDALSEITDRNLPEGDTHVLVVYDYGGDYNEETGERNVSVVTGRGEELKPRYITYNINDANSLHRALYDLGSLRPSALYGLKASTWTAPKTKEEKPKEEGSKKTGKNFDDWN